MSNLLPFKKKVVDEIPIYGTCECDGETFFPHLSDYSDEPEVISWECTTCRGVFDVPPSMVVECEFE